MPYDWIQAAFDKADDKPCQIAPGKPGNRCRDPKTQQFVGAAQAGAGRKGDKKPEKKVKKDEWEAVLGTPQGRAATNIVERLKDAGHEAYFAGGCVRDMLLGRECHDIDIATSATPKEVSKIWPDSKFAGEAFGVSRVRDGGEEFEIATFRTESGYADGRHPDEVKFSTAEKDAERRDFTINAMFFDPAEKKVIDYVGGQKDLEDGVLRAVGGPEERFAEDYLRMMRAVRFASRFGFDIDDKTADAVRDNADKITEISQERITDELVKALKTENPGQVLRDLDDLDLLDKVLPEIAALKGVEQSPVHHPEGDVWTHTLQMLDKMEPKGDPVLALAVLFHDVGKPSVSEDTGERITFHGHDKVGARLFEDIGRRMKLSNDEIKDVSWLIGNHMLPMAAQEMRTAKLKRLLAQPLIDRLLALHRADAAASDEDFSAYEWLRRKKEELPPEQVRPAPLITGHDLIALGFSPGPLFSEVLTAVQDAQLDGAVSDREEALAFARQEADKQSRAKKAIDWPGRAFST